MRPTGVTLSAYYQFFRGAVVALFAGGIFFVGGMAARLASLAAEGNNLQRILGGLGHFMGVALLIYAAVQVVCGIGLLLLQNWARILTLVFSALGILVLLPRALHLRPVSTLFALLNLAVLIYLLLPETASYFINKNLPADSTPVKTA
ncbi:MAG TPA: DUF2127 domain-containing protein [Candidatus Acidoferrum sp.]|nr:DUF2127 domain-containing protein [Candidatus Acidoferrum sp.]